jgi:hypothetical protein
LVVSPVIAPFFCSTLIIPTPDQTIRALSGDLEAPVGAISAGYASSYLATGKDFAGLGVDLRFVLKAA